MSPAGPPSSPRIAINRPPVVNGATVELCWLQSLDNGGSPDLHYNIYVLESGDTEFRRVATAEPTQSDLVCRSVELNALSSYSVAVTAASGATNDPQNFSDVSVVQDRFILFYVTTCAPVTVTGVCVCGWVCACVCVCVCVCMCVWYAWKYQLGFTSK